MNLHETLTNGRSIPHVVPIAFRGSVGEPRRPALSPGTAHGPFPTPSLVPDRHRRPLRRAAPARGRLRGHRATTATCSTPRPTGARSRTHTPACYQKALSELPGDVDNYLPAARANLIAAMRRDDTLSSGTPAVDQQQPRDAERRRRAGSCSRRARPGHRSARRARPGARRPGPHAGRRARQRRRAAPAGRARHVARTAAHAPPRRGLTDPASAPPPG